MKASVNKITDDAKRRDTLGRNNVELVQSKTDIGNTLWNIGLRNSQTAGLKLTPVIIQDPDGSIYLLHYSIATINDAGRIIADEFPTEEKVDGVKGDADEKEVTVE